MHLDEPAHDGEAEAQAGELSGDGTLALLEGLEDSGERFGFDADSGIGDLDFQAVTLAVLVGRTKGDRSFFGGEFDRVGHQVQENLLEAAGIGPDVVILSAQGQRHFQPLFINITLEHGNDVVQDGVGIHDFEVKADFAAGDARDVEQVVNEPSLGFDIAANHVHVAPQLLGRDIRIVLDEADGGEHRRERRAQLALGALLVGDVAGDFGGADDAAGGVADGGDRHGDFDAPSIFCHADGFEVIDALAAVNASENLSLLIVAIGREQDFDGLADHLLGGVAEDALRGFIPTGDDALKGFGDDGIVGGLDNGSEPSLRHCLRQVVRRRLIHRI